MTSSLELTMPLGYTLVSVRREANGFTVFPGLREGPGPSPSEAHVFTTAESLAAHMLAWAKAHEAKDQHEHLARPLIDEVREKLGYPRDDPYKGLLG